MCVKYTSGNYREEKKTIRYSRNNTIKEKNKKKKNENPTRNSKKLIPTWITVNPIFSVLKIHIKKMDSRTFGFSIRFFIYLRGKKNKTHFFDK